jgi:hypothetical protein
MHRCWAAGLFALYFVSPAAAQDAEVKKTVEKGVAFLKTSFADPSAYTAKTHNTGLAALAGMALLESGVPTADPTVKALRDFVREQIVGDLKTYHVALAIMFLDRFGSRDDESLIQMLGFRLLVGQDAGGGWTYECGEAIGDVQTRQLKAVFLRPPPANDDPKADPKPESPPEKRGGKLHPELEKLLPNLNRIIALQQARPTLRADHSNTQFAVLGLWVARRHAVPVDPALMAAEARFLRSQFPNGGWGYTAMDEPVTSTMTCTGLIALAVGQGVREAKPNDPRQASVTRGLQQLARFLTQEYEAEPGVKLWRRRDTRFAHFHYFLWSLERVGVLFGIDTVGKLDWYRWGSDVLVTSQNADGSWAGTHGADADTSFALLFLNRANVAKDLAVRLKGKVQDPGVGVLRSGTGFDPLAGGKAPKVGPETPAGKVQLVGDAPAAAQFEIEAARLTKAYVSATGADDEKWRTYLRDTKGAVYTEALARAAGQLDGNRQKQARDALSERLTRMTAGTLRELMKGSSAEARRGAALACAMKEDKAHVPDLIELIADNEEFVVRAAKAALKSLTGKDLGPAADASAADRAKALADWRAWWKTQNPGG